MPDGLTSTLLPPTDRSKNFPFAPFRHRNYNVVCIWINTLIVGVANNIWYGTVLASFLYELMGKSNVYAGYVEAAQVRAPSAARLPRPRLRQLARLWRNPNPNQQPRPRQLALLWRRILILALTLTGPDQPRGCTAARLYR